ncbi:MAG: Ig-like domain-containing protein, partial [Gemmatimonadota bacterium]
MAQVVITSPSAPVVFGALGRTVTFTAQPRDAAGNPLSGRAVTWSSSSAAVTINGTTGVATSAGNGTAQITATSEGVPSSPVTVTVSQVTASVVVTGGPVAFGAIGKTRQLSATVLDSGNTVILGRTVTWSLAGPGTVASVSASGLVTALAVGSGDSAVATTATGPTVSGKAPISVTQVVFSITVTSAAGTAPDTLYTTGRPRQFNAAAADSNGNAIPGTTFTWSSTSTAVATVDAAGLITAVADGLTSIQAT